MKITHKEIFGRIFQYAIILSFAFGVGWLATSLIENENKEYRFETGPCGTKLFAGNYFLGEHKEKGVNVSFPFFYDSGDFVWKLKVKVPETWYLGPPTVEYEKVMERSPKSCTDWVRRTGIDLRR